MATDILNKKLEEACRNGDIETVKKLLSYKRGVDPTWKNYIALNEACYYGNLEIIKILINDTRVKLSDRNCSYALAKAVYRGHYGIVEFLLNDGRIDPAASDNYALKNTTTHLDIISLLLRDSRVRNAVNSKYVMDNPMICVNNGIKMRVGNPIIMFFHEMHKDTFDELTEEQKTVFRLKFH